MPFHCSSSTPPPVAVFCWPTATQNDEVGHETAFKLLEAEPDAALALVQLEALTNGGLVRAAPREAMPAIQGRAAMTLLAITIRRSPSTGASSSRRGPGVGRVTKLPERETVKPIRAPGAAFALDRRAEAGSTNA